MRIFILFLFILIVSFTSCDGRDRVNKSNTENFDESNLSNLFFEDITYIPKEYTEIVTDTILSSEIKVNVKYYSLLDKGVSFNYENNKRYYRQFESQITVYKKNKLLFTDVLNVLDFKENNTLKFWNNAILQFVWLDDYKSNEEHIQFYCSFLDPHTEAYKFYKIYFNNFGKRKIELIESS